LGFNVISIAVASSLASTGSDESAIFLRV
jgi:hypothetical protein